VLGALPGARLLDGAVVGTVRVAAHTADDPLGEQHPDLLVVVELGVPLERLDGGHARIGVPRGIELEPEPPSHPLVPLGPEVRPGHDEREVDVEEDCAEGHTGDGRRYAAGLRLASDGSRARTSSSRPASSSAVITPPPSGACARPMPQGAAISDRP
jgi:hypothetical protein